MKIYYTKNALSDLEKIDNSLRQQFIKHAEKIFKSPFKRHLKHGMPYFVEEVTKQARLIYNFEEETLYIIRCFKNHKEYEKWFKSFK
ncbi:MAG: hypothetical protein ABIH20_03345 [Candidatus Diapherotrites archaeon]